MSDLLQPDQRLIIAIDGCDRIDLNNQFPDSNLFYLPRYLPERVYFLLTRRPFFSEKSVLQNDPIPIRERDALIPQQLAEIIDLALVEKPEIYFKSATEFKQALLSVLTVNS